MRSYTLILLVILQVGITSLCEAQKPKKPLFVTIKTESANHYGTLVYGDSTGIFIDENGQIVGVRPTAIDHMEVHNNVRVGRTMGHGAIIGGSVFGILAVASDGEEFILPSMAVGALAFGAIGGVFAFTGKYNYDLDVKGEQDRYYTIVPLLERKSPHAFRIQDWQYQDYPEIHYDGPQQELGMTKIPTHPYFEIGGGFMFSNMGDQMVDAFQQFGGTVNVSFLGFNFGNVTYPIDRGKKGSFYMRSGVYVDPKLDVQLTYRKSGLQQAEGLIDFNFYLKSENLSAVANYLLAKPDYFLGNRWKVGLGGGPAINFLTSEVQLVHSGYVDPLFGLFIASDASTHKKSHLKAGLNLDFKVDYYLRRNVYFTTSLEYVFIPRITVEREVTDDYTFEGASINPSALHWSFGLGVNLF